MNSFFEKNLLIFDVENWFWKYDFGTFWQTIVHRMIVLKQFPLSMSILGQISCILGPSIFKFHNRTDINIQWVYENSLWLKIKTWLVSYFNTKWNTFQKRFYLHWHWLLQLPISSLHRHSHLPPFPQSLSVLHISLTLHFWLHWHIL